MLALLLSLLLLRELCAPAAKGQCLRKRACSRLRKNVIKNWRPANESSLCTRTTQGKAHILTQANGWRWWLEKS